MICTLLTTISVYRIAMIVYTTRSICHFIVKVQETHANILLYAKHATFYVHVVEPYFAGERSRAVALFVGNPDTTVLLRIINAI